MSSLVYKYPVLDHPLPLRMFVQSQHSSKMLFDLVDIGRWQFQGYMAAISVAVRPLGISRCHTRYRPNFDSRSLWHGFLGPCTTFAFTL